MKPRRSFGARQPSRAAHRVSLMAVLLHRDDLDALNVESLARSHGMKVAEVAAAIDGERKRRAAR